MCFFSETKHKPAKKNTVFFNHLKTTATTFGNSEQNKKNEPKVTIDWLCHDLFICEPGVRN